MKLRPQPPSLVTAPYPELSPDRNLKCAVSDALDLRNSVLRWKAHLNSGTGQITRSCGTWPSGAFVCIEPHADLAGRGKAEPFASQNYTMSSFLRGENLDLLRTHPLRGSYVFRNEPLTHTSIRSQSVDRVIIEIGHRGQIDYRALVDEVRRIAIPGAIIIIIVYDILRVDDWSIDDPLSPKLLLLRHRMRRSPDALKVFGLREVATDKKLYATEQFDQRQIMRHIDESPECQRRMGGWDWTATGYLFRELRQNWGRIVTKRNVRRRARVFVGKVPAAPTEPNERA